MIHKYIKALTRFNAWEDKRIDQISDRLSDQRRLAAVFELYELIPENARQRPVNVEGIIKMRKALACLK